MMLEEGTIWEEDIYQVGGSFFLKLTPEIREYLECVGKEKEVHLILKADRGKHGKFIGIGIVGVDVDGKRNTKEGEGDKDRKSSKDDASPKRSSKSDE